MKQLKLRNEQLEPFEERGFKRLINSVNLSWPKVCEKLGEKGVRRRIKKSLLLAHRHKIILPNNMTRVVHLMFVLDNEDLDILPEFNWVKAILNWDASENFRLKTLEFRAEKEYEKKL
jgi:hypothetical protein